MDQSGSIRNQNQRRCNIRTNQLPVCHMKRMCACFDEQIYMLVISNLELDRLDVAPNRTSHFEKLVFRIVSEPSFSPTCGLC